MLKRRFGVKIRVTGWNNENGELVPLQAEFEMAGSMEETVQQGKALLARQIKDELGDFWLHDIKFWQIGGITWQLMDELNELQ